jgi:tetratricopeptide (TPR) repeat protein
MRYALVLALALAGAATAADKYAVYESEHFELFTDGPRGRARDVLAHFERVRSFFVKALRIRDPIVKPRIVLFESEKDYRDYALNETSAAHYFALAQRDYIVMRASTSERDRRIAVHEYLHLLIRHSDQDYPLWLNEGTAELYSNIDSVKRAVRIGSPIPEHVFLLRNDWVPLTELLEVDHESRRYNKRAHAGPFYAASWALTHMLTLDPRYRPNRARFVEQLSAGAGAEDAARECFQKSIAQVEADLREYVRRNALNVQDFEVQFDAVDEMNAGRPLGEYDWDVATADLLTGIQKHDQAAARLEALTNMQPARPEAWESRAFLALRTQEQKGRREAFEKARALGSKNPYLAYWSPVFVADSKLIRELLSGLARQYPSFIEGRIRLGQYQLSDGEPKAAYVTLKGITSINRRQVPTYFPAFIQAAWHAGNLAEARASASQFLKFSRKPGDLEQAKRLFAMAMKEPPKPGEDAPGSFSVDVVVPPPPQPHTEPVVLAGTLVNLECAEPGVLHLKAAEGVVKFLIDDPAKLRLIGAADGMGELTCGAQERPARIGYYLRPGLPGGARGVARSIEFAP